MRFSDGYKSGMSLLYVRMRSLLVCHGFGGSECLGEKGRNTTGRSQQPQVPQSQALGAVQRLECVFFQT